MVVLATLLLFKVDVFVGKVDHVADQLLWSQTESAEVQVHHHAVGDLVDLDVRLDVVGVVRSSQSALFRNSVLLSVQVNLIKWVCGVK